MKNHLGSYECKLCLTLHNNEGNYLAHTQGKRHQQNLARRAAKEARDNPVLPQANRGSIKPRKTVKIGRPGASRSCAVGCVRSQRKLLSRTQATVLQSSSTQRHRSDLCSSRLTTQRLRQPSNRGIASCPRMSSAWKRLTKRGSTYCLRQNHTRRSGSRFPTKKLTRTRANSRPPGMMRARRSCCSFISKERDQSANLQHHHCCMLEQFRQLLQQIEPPRECHLQRPCKKVSFCYSSQTRTMQQHLSMADIRTLSSGTRTIAGPHLRLDRQQESATLVGQWKF